MRIVILLTVKFISFSFFINILRCWWRIRKLVISWNEENMFEEQEEEEEEK